jgi:hypothetical protein
VSLGWYGAQRSHHHKATTHGGCSPRDDGAGTGHPWLFCFLDPCRAYAPHQDSSPPKKTNQKKNAVAKMKPLALALTCLAIAHALDAGAVGAIDHITEGQNLTHGDSLVSCI